MNREQLGTIGVVGLAVLALSISAPTYAAIVDAPSDDVGSGSAVFNEDVTLEDSPNPQNRDLSGSPFLEALYDTVTSSGESRNASNDTGATGGDTSLLPIAIAVGGLFCIGIAGSVGWYWRVRRTSGNESAPFDTRPDESESVADRPDSDVLEQFDAEELSNDVYRSWYELVSSLGSRRDDSLTPSELAEAAIERGFDEPAVVELTVLFETVRYGTASATPEAERRARRALERIEREEDGP